MRILVAGGRRGGASPLSCWYEPASNAWTEAAYMTYRRDSAAAAVVQGNVYVTGGRNAEFEEEKLCERFEPSTNAWIEVASLHGYRRDHGAAALRDRLYVVGGIRAGQLLKSVESYDPVANAWTAAPELPVPMGPAAAFTIRGALWVVGEAGDYRAFRFDASASRWEEGPIVSRGRRWLALAAADDAIYTFGGSTSDGVSGIVERCELASGTIARVSDLPTARRCAAAVTIDHRIVVIGGELSDGTELANAEAFDTHTGAWEALAPMPWGCASATAVCLPT